MSDDEMTDTSQKDTQSVSQLDTSMSFSSQHSQPAIESWGHIIIYKITRRRLGMRSNVTHYTKTEEKTFELVKEKTTFGRKGDCSVATLVDPNKLAEISSTHFSITKNDVNDPLCPIFIEDSSTNGTFFRQFNNDVEMKYNNNERIDEKIKRRIMAHKDMIFIEKIPTICFEFHSHQEHRNHFPDDINKEYHIGKVLGEGACGVVHFVQNRRTCQSYALKITSSNDENSVNNMLKEVHILEQLKHPCILQLYKKKTYVDKVAIFVDYMVGGDLFTRLQSCGYFQESFIKFLFYQICCGVQYLHSKLVMHRDLKPENILLATTDKYTLVKVADFGLSKFANQNALPQTQCGTKAYLAPEVRSRIYTNKVDIWSLGVILYTCLCGALPFSKSNENYTVTFRQKHKQWNDVSEEAKNIIRETLRVKAEERPSAEELLNQRNWLSKNDHSVKRALDIINNPINEKT